MTQQQVIAKQRKSLLIYSQRWGISQACKTFNISRTTYYKVKKQYIETGCLEPKIRRKPRMPNEIKLSKKKVILKLVRDKPGVGLDHYMFLIKKHGVKMSRGTIYNYLKRFGLTYKYQRLIYVEKTSKLNQPLTEASMRMIKKASYKIASGLWPGQIVALDTFYVGHLKGVGRIYQTTGIDLFSRYGWAHLSTNKSQKSTINFVENILMPKFFANGVALESILTDNGTEFTGAEFGQMLKDYGINHNRIPKRKPLCNGYCERFQRTIYDEFYKPIFRTMFFKNLDTLQNKLNEYLIHYNMERPHFGIHKSGVFPIDALLKTNSFLRLRFKELLT